MNKFKYKDFYHSSIYMIWNQRLVPSFRTDYGAHRGRLGVGSAWPSKPSTCQYLPQSLTPPRPLESCCQRWSCHMTSDTLTLQAVVVFSAERPSVAIIGYGTEGASYDLVVKALYNWISPHQKELIANFFSLPLTCLAVLSLSQHLTRTPSSQKTCFPPTFPFSYLNSSLLQLSLPRSVSCHYLTLLHVFSSIFFVCITFFFSQFCLRFAYLFNDNVRSLCLIFERLYEIGERIVYKHRKTSLNPIWYWAGYLTSLNLNFTIHKKGTKCNYLIELGSMLAMGWNPIWGHC